MNPMILLSAFMAPAALLLGLYILFLDRKNLIHRLFFLMMLLIACWQFVALEIFIGDDRETFIFWYKLSSISLLFVPITLHIVSLIARADMRIMRRALGVFYAAFIFFIYQNFNLNLAYRDFIKIDGYWNFIRTDVGFMSVSFTFTVLLVLLITMVLLINWRRKTIFTREKRQALVLSVSICLLFVFLIADHFVYRFFSDRDLGISAYYTFIWPLGIGIAIIKYGFLSFSPGLYTREVFENIEESILVLDCNRKIALANTNMKKIFGDIRGNHLRSVISGYDEIVADIDNLYKGRLNNFTARVSCTGAYGSTPLIDARFSVITDRYNDRVGVLIIGREVKGLKQFTCEHDITKREIEVIRLLTTGVPNREIAERLNITERTVKSHMLNIHGKLNVRNKVELMNVLKRYGLA